jgi:tetratricopeptide (TPR) repeat protein
MSEGAPSSRPPEGPATVDIEGPAPTIIERLPAGTVLGRYVVMAPLGEGGTGIVYAAYDPELDRKVAIKLVRPLARTQARLLREAQAMARLHHPNVVVVHDVGTWRDRVFVAMEFVDGWTLRSWPRKEAPSPKAILEAYVAAGRGLEAAHAAGFVHRDFKPDNVLVGRDGAVRVTDFGLARAGNLTPDPDLDRGSDPPTASTAITRPEGPVVGTPGYIAPEQYERAPPDPRADQFSFCVALYEELCGHLPFDGDGEDALRNATLAGRVRPFDREAKVPAHVARAILRGLSVDPTARFPSMRALLDELTRDPHARLRKLAATALGFGAVIAIALGARASVAQKESLCRGAEEELAGVWDEAQKSAVRAAFEATGAPYAGQAYQHAAANIERYVGDWIAMRTDACRATRIRGDQTEAILTLRSACLDTRARELRSLVGLLSHADRDVVQSSIEASAKLSPIDACGDVAALTAPVAPPPDRAARERVLALRGRLAELRARASAGKYASAADDEGVLLVEARATGYAPLVAETLVELGAAQTGGGRYDAAEATLREAIDVADEAHHDEARGRALVALAELSGRWLGHYAPAAQYATAAVHVARRIGNARMESFALEQASREHGYLGELDRALDEGKRSLELTARLFAPDDLRRARVNGSLAVALAELGRFDDAERADREALAIAERALGPSHPLISDYLDDLALDLIWSGRPADAVPFDQRAVDLTLAELGPESPRYGDALNNLGYAQLKMRDFPASMAQNEKALAIFERHFGPDHVGQVYPLEGLGEALLETGDPGRALPLLERATRLAESHALDAEAMGDCHFLTGRAVFEATHDPARAVALVTRAVGDYGRVPRLAARRAAAEAWLAAHASPAR